MEYYSAIKKEKLCHLQGKCMELEIIMLGEKSHTQTSVPCFLLYIESKKTRHES
jgi:hypothetical protein